MARVAPSARSAYESQPSRETSGGGLTHGGVAKRETLFPWKCRGVLALSYGGKRGAVLGTLACTDALLCALRREKVLEEKKRKKKSELCKLSFINLVSVTDVLDVTEKLKARV